MNPFPTSRGPAAEPRRRPLRPRPPSAPRLVPSGFTVVELLVVLLLLSLAGAALVPAARRLRDRLAVLAAREAVAGVVARTRLDALAHGGARLVLATRPPTARVEVAGERGSSVDLREFGVALELSGKGEEASLSFDALGIGRVASRTVWLRRGGAEAGLVLSAYGRLRRR